jgi:hypothetical protein
MGGYDSVTVHTPSLSYLQLAAVGTMQSRKGAILDVCTLHPCQPMSTHAPIHSQPIDSQLTAHTHTFKQKNEHLWQLDDKRLPKNFQKMPRRTCDRPNHARRWRLTRLRLASIQSCKPFLIMKRSTCACSRDSRCWRAYSQNAWRRGCVRRRVERWAMRRM